MDGDQGALNKLTHGEVLASIHDATTWVVNRFKSLPAWTQKFFDKEGSDALAVLKVAVPVGVTDIIAGKFTTDSFVKAGKDIYATLKAQGITTFSMQSVMANLNMAVDTDPAAQAALSEITSLVSPAVQPGSADPSTSAK